MRAVFAALAVLAAAPARAQDEVRGSFYVRRDGTAVEAAIQLDIKRGWHLYHGPTREDIGPPEAVGKPTTVAISGAAVEWGEVEFPQAERVVQDLGIGEPTWILQHEGKLVLRVHGRAPETVDLSTLSARVDGLTCSEVTGQCIPYGEVLTVAGPGSDALFAAKPAASSAAKPASSAAKPASSAAKPASSEGKPEPREAEAEPEPAGVAARTSAEDEAQPHGALFVRKRGADGVQAAIEIEIPAGWHLYHGPTREDLGPPDAVGKPTTVKLSGQGIEWGPVEFPAAERAEQDLGGGAATWILQHEGTIVLRAAGRLSAAADVATVRAEIDGLVCSDVTGLCVPYRETLASKGEGSEALFSSGGASTSGAPTSSGAAVASDAAPSPSGSADGGLWLFLLAAVGWGLFTLLMPCTYPMIPITISFFTKQATLRERSAVPLAIAYGAGIVAIFVLIGVLVGPVIIRFATHPVTNLVIGGLFLVFALALFGAIELRPPAFLMSAAGQASARGGYTGVFLMGATLVVTSFTCTAPFVGSLLSFGATQGGLGRVALGMAVFGLTMAVPFVLLSLVPGKLKAMPRSGEWMHVLKVFLGFVEVAAALKFFSNTDIVWNEGPRVLPRELFLLLWAALFLGAALFLLGLLRLQGESPDGIGPKRMVGGLGSLLFAAYCLYGALGHTLDPIVTAIAPYPTEAASTGSAGAARARHAIVKDDFEAARALARRAGQGQLVNFTGYTCVNCRLMEEKVFPLPEVQEELAHWVEARLHTDGPPREEENRALQARLTKASSESGRSSVATPLYMGVDPKDVRILVRRDGAYTPEAFVELLRAARKQLER